MGSLRHGALTAAGTVRDSHPIPSYPRPRTGRGYLCGYKDSLFRATKQARAGEVFNILSIAVPTPSQRMSYICGVIFVHPDTTHHPHLPGHLLAADRHRARRAGHDPLGRLRGRLPRQHAGHRGARARHARRGGRRASGRHRLPRQGHLVPRPALPGAARGALRPAWRSLRARKRRIRSHPRVSARILHGGLSSNH